MAGHNDIPRSWLSTTLEQVAEIHDELREPVNADERATRVGPYPYYGATGQVGWIDDYLMEGEYVLLGEDGAPFLDPCKPKAYLVSGKAWVNNHAHVLQGTPNVCINRFLLYALNQTDYRGFANGTTRLKLTQAAMRRLPIRLAPLPEQKRVVDKIEELFSDLDAGVAALERVRANLKRYRASVLKAAVEGRLTEQWRKENPSAEPASKLLERILTERRKKWEEQQLAKFKESGKSPPKNWRDKYEEPAAPDTSNLPELPKEWCWASVDQLSIVVRGASPRPAGDPEYFGGGHTPWITVGQLTTEDTVYLRSVSESLTAAGRERSRFIEPDTLLLTNSGATLGVPKIIMIGGCINDGSVALLGLDYPLKLYLYYFLKSQTERLRAINQGAAQPNLNTGIVKAIVVPLPPQTEQHEINGELELRLSVQRETERQMQSWLKRTDRLRQSVLKRAFEGKLVPQDPSDLPVNLSLTRAQAADDIPVSLKSSVRQHRIRSSQERPKR